MSRDYTMTGITGYAASEPVKLAQGKDDPTDFTLRSGVRPYVPLEDVPLDEPVWLTQHVVTTALVKSGTQRPHGFNMANLSARSRVKALDKPRTFQAHLEHEFEVKDSVREWFEAHGTTVAVIMASLREKYCR